MGQTPEVVSQVLDVLTERFGTTAAELWDVLLRQHQLFGVVDAAVAVLFFGVTCFLLFNTLPRARSIRDECDAAWATAYTCTAAVVTAIVCLILSVEAFLRIGNPTYYALREILNVIK